jgi:hypothetical protein
VILRALIFDNAERRAGDGVLFPPAPGIDSPTERNALTLCPNLFMIPVSER